MEYLGWIFCGIVIVAMIFHFYLVFTAKKPEYCCDSMKFQLERKCEQHNNDPWECPDYVMAKFENGLIGIPIRDGGGSIGKIDYCPWCGTKL